MGPRELPGNGRCPGRSKAGWGEAVAVQIVALVSCYGQEESNMFNLGTQGPDGQRAGCQDVIIKALLTCAPLSPCPCG